MAILSREVPQYYLSEILLKYNWIRKLGLHISLPFQRKCWKLVVYDFSLKFSVRSTMSSNRLWDAGSSSKTVISDFSTGHGLQNRGKMWQSLSWDWRLFVIGTGIISGDKSLDDFWGLLKPQLPSSPWREACISWSSSFCFAYIADSSVCAWIAYLSNHKFDSVWF